MGIFTGGLAVFEEGGEAANVAVTDAMKKTVARTNLETAEIFTLLTLIHSLAMNKHRRVHTV